MVLGQSIHIRTYTRVWFLAHASSDVLSIDYVKEQYSCSDHKHSDPSVQMVGPTLATPSLHHPKGFGSWVGLVAGRSVRHNLTELSEGTSLHKEEILDGELSF